MQNTRGKSFGNTKIGFIKVKLINYNRFVLCFGLRYRFIQCFLIFVCAIFLVSFDLKAQVTRIKKLDLNGALNAGTLLATVTPPFTINTIQKIFDGNPYTEAVVQNSDSVTIMLVFDAPVKISKSKVFFWNNGEWSLEAANTEADLDQKSGSYQLWVDHEKYAYFISDSSSFPAGKARCIRLTARNLQGNNIYMGEWDLYTPFILTSLQILPDHPKLLPGTSFQLKVMALDDEGTAYPYNLKQPVMWSSSNRAIVSMGEMGDIHGHSLGTALITAQTTALSGTTTAEVVADYESPRAEPLFVKVALILQDPIIDIAHKRRIHQVRGWSNPRDLIRQISEEFHKASDGVANFQIVETHNDGKIFTRIGGKLMTIDTLAYYFGSISHLYGRDVKGTLQNLAEVQGKVKFDYNAMIDYYNLDTKRNNGKIDEVWVYSFPFSGMYESQLVGPGAFWWNSPPLEHPGLEKLLSVMGWNYERGVAEALHSFGHRVESAMRHIYGRWDVHNPNPNNWELFTTIDKDKPGKAQVGNIHFPPNGLHDYDYGDKRYVVTYADNWKRYPILLNQKRTVNCQEWGCSQRDYMRWWFNHLPRYKGVTDGILNNWWYYAIDYEGAVGKASQLTNVDEEMGFLNTSPDDYSLEQNYPNPFNLTTQIRFFLKKPRHVALKIYNISGQEVKTLIDKKEPAGQYEVKFDGNRLASGVYFCQLTAGNFRSTHKMILLK